MTFRAGDSVHHTPTGQNLLLACDEEAQTLYATVGMRTYSPQTCTLLAAADDQQRLAMLTETSRSINRWSVVAARQLAAVQPPPAPSPASPVSPITPIARHGLSLELFIPHDVVELQAADQAALAAQLETVTYAALERMKVGTAAKLKTWLEAHR